MKQTPKRARKGSAEPARVETADDDSGARTNASDVHANALKEYERGWVYDRANIDAAYLDLKFRAEEGQWDERAKREREAQQRPCLTVDKTGQFVRQVTGDIRQMRPSIKVTPVDERGDKTVADRILPGMFRYIEQRSDASAAYFCAIDGSVAAGIGHFEITTEYGSDDTFNQEIAISPIRDGVSVVWDPDAVKADRSDAMFCFVPTDMSHAAFKRRFPGKSPAPLTGSQTSETFSTWCTTEMVRVARYFRKVPTTRRLALLPDGGVDDVTDDPEAEAAAASSGAEIEERESHKVEMYVISAVEVLEGPAEIPGAHIPIVPVIGEEIHIGNRTVRRGIIRPMKDAQRMYNYGVSTHTEVVALQPKAPFIGTQKMFEGSVDEWESANIVNYPYLTYTVDPDAPQGAKPERVQPPVSAQGLLDIMQQATADMSAVTGIYPASLGAASNETSGKAIMARQREGDTGTYLYIDNFRRALRRAAQIVIGMIPHVYDTQRTIRIIGDDGRVDVVDINKPETVDMEVHRVMHDVTVGAYDVAIDMGPSFASRREEAREGMIAFMQSCGPQVSQMFIDLFAKQQDWPLADKIADRAHMLLPPAIQAMEAQKAGEPMPEPPPPAEPTPEQQVAAKKLDVEQFKVEVERLKAELERAKIEHETVALATGAQAAQQPQQADDPRVDAIARAVETIAQTLDQVITVVEEMAAPPDPGLEPAPDLMQPPPGGFFNGEAAPPGASPTI